MDGNHVKTATIAPDGEVSSRLANGDGYTSQVPTAIPDAQLATQLLAHNVQVTGTAAGGVSLLGLIFDLLPLLLFVGFFCLGGPAEPGRGRWHYQCGPLQSTRL